IAFYHFRNPQLSPSVKDLIVKQEFSSKKSLTSCEGLLYKRQPNIDGFARRFSAKNLLRK
ncbi:hypothetical protein, partial [Vibrio vulnificus]|uniref:hypothetical protein n=1 Tax=Vibrio vulnificus TaxID=672 RepID=UPI0010E1FAD3